MNDNCDIPWLSPIIWELIGKPSGYKLRRCDQCNGLGRFLSYCWSAEGDPVDCPICDGTGKLYVRIDK